MCPGVNSASKNEYQDTPGGKVGQCVTVTTLLPSQCRKSRKSGSLNLPDTQGPVLACSGTALLLPYTCSAVFTVSDSTRRRPPTYLCILLPRAAPKKNPFTSPYKTKYYGPFCPEKSHNMLLRNQMGQQGHKPSATVGWNPLDPSLYPSLPCPHLFCSKL